MKNSYAKEIAAFLEDVEKNSHGFTNFPQSFAEGIHVFVV